MKIIYFDWDDKCTSIGITGDHQLTGNRLCIGVTAEKSNIGWIKLIWCQGAQVKTQQNSILLILQMRDHGCLVSKVSKRHGGKHLST